MNIPHPRAQDAFGSNDHHLKIKLPAMVTTRNAARHSDAGSGSQYSASEKSMNLGDEDAEGEEEEEEEIVVSTRGRAHKRVNYVESASEDDIQPHPPARNGVFKKGGLGANRPIQDLMNDDDIDEEPPLRRTRRSTRAQSKNLDGFVEEDEDAAMHEEYDDGSKRRHTRLRSARMTRQAAKEKPLSSGRQTRSKARQRQSDHDYEDHRGNSSGSGEDADGSLVEDDLDLALEPEPEPEPEDDNDGKPYALRQRQKINYAIPPPIEEMARPPPKPSNRNANRGGPKGRRGLGWSASGAELGRWMGMPGDDSVRILSVAW